MHKTMYEINWHYKGKEEDTFSHCTVTPIDVIRSGVLKGCSLPTITAIDSKGDKFTGSIENYFVSEDSAWCAVRTQVEFGLASCKNELARANSKIDAFERFLRQL